MAFEPVSANINYLKLKELTPGSVVISNGRITDFKKGEYGITWIVQDEDGAKGLGETGQLKYYRETGTVSLGSVVRLTYNGKKDLPKGKTAHDFKLEIDHSASAPMPSSSDEETIPF